MGLGKKVCHIAMIFQVLTMVLLLWHLKMHLNIANSKIKFVLVKNMNNIK